MKIKKLIALVLAVLVLTANLAGCKLSRLWQKDTEQETNEEEPTELVISSDKVAEYVIVRPDAADQEVINAASNLYTALLNKFGNKITITTDYAKTEADIPVGTKEILVGLTNRPESAGVRYHDYEIGFKNDRIFVNGGNSAAVAEAVNYFISNYVSDNGITVPRLYATAKTYPMENLTVNGQLLMNFSVKQIEGDLDDTLRAYLGEQVGIYSKSPTNNEIILTTDRKYGVTEMDIYMDGTNLILANSSQIGDSSFVVEYFLDQIKNMTSNEVKLAGNVSLTINGYRSATNADVEELRAQTDARIEEIRATENMVIPQGAIVYYVSNNGNDKNDGKTPETAWKTLDKVNSTSVVRNSYVCFERGGLWRGKIIAKPGVTYTAYGTGEKPIIYGSPENGADPTKWKKASGTKNIWDYVGSEKWDDVGTLVFNEGEACAVKAIREWKANGDIYNWSTGQIFNNGYKDLTNDLHFYHDKANNGPIYLYSEENPGNRFESIEFNVKQNLINVTGGAHGVTVDNLCLKYTGVHGVGAGTVNNLTVQNCELGWIGGSNQGIIQERNFETRFGNGVEIYGGCENYIVKNNYFYQIYDSAVTHQYSGIGDNVYNHTNVQYVNNVMDYCGFPIEYFVSGASEGNPSVMTDLLMEGNHMWYAGYGFSEQRPPADRSWGASIKGHCGGSGNRANGYIIKNNIFAFRIDRFVSIISDLTNPDGSDSMPTFIGNIFVEEYGVKFGRVKQADAPDYRDDVIYNFKVLAYIEERTFGRSKDNEAWFAKK